MSITSRSWPFCLGLLFCLAALAQSGDSIVIGGVRYENVIVQEGASRYYVQIPAEGRTISVLKANVRANDVLMSTDLGARNSLLQEWEGNNEKRPKPALKRQDESASHMPTVAVEAPIAESVVIETTSTPAAPSRTAEKVSLPTSESIIEAGESVDENGVKSLVVRGNREKDWDYEGRAAQQRLEQQRAEEQRLLDNASQAASSSSSFSSSASESGSYSGGTSKSTGGAKTVHVKGYTKKDGTYVQSHYRSSPRR